MTAPGTRILVLTIGGTDYTAQVSKAVITSGAADSDFVTFADAAAGGSREYRLEFTAAQDFASATLWNQVFTAAGTSVAFLLKPHGSAAASPTTPHFSGNVTITEPDGDFIGGEANASTTAKFLFECSWVLAAKPVRVVA